MYLEPVYLAEVTLGLEIAQCASSICFHEVLQPVLENLAGMQAAVLQSTDLLWEKRRGTPLV